MVAMYVHVAVQLSSAGLKMGNHCGCKWEWLNPLILWLKTRGLFANAP